MIKKIFFLFVIGFCCRDSLFAQKVNLLEETSKMRNAYRQQSFLSYRIKYNITTTSHPEEILDTMSGIMKMHGDKFWGILNEIEFMQNHEYLISAYYNYRMLKVDTPSAIYPALANISFIDSLIGKDNYTLTSSVEGNNKSLLFVFKQDKFLYKTFSIVYDATTYFLKQLIYTVAAEGGNESKYELETKGDKLIKVDFSDYSIRNFDTNVFNTENYLHRQGDLLSPEGKFAEYQLNIGSSNVLK